MKTISEQASMSSDAVEIEQLPEMYIFQWQGQEVVLCNPEVVQGEDGEMSLRYVVITNAVVRSYRVWRVLGNRPIWHASDVTGALTAQGTTPPEAMMRVML